MDRLRDVEPDAEMSLLFVEADDQYLVILRLDEGEDLRVFGSDSAFADESRLGALLLGDIEAPALEIDELAEPAARRRTTRPTSRPPTRTPTRSATPICWPTSGVSSHRLLELCAPRGHAARPT